MTGMSRTFLEQKKWKTQETDTRALDERDRGAQLDELNNCEGERGGGDIRGWGCGRGRNLGRGRIDDDRGGTGIVIQDGVTEVVVRVISFSSEPQFLIQRPNANSNRNRRYK